MVSGHSMGGAIALHAALDLEHLGIPVALYTYGCPRVGNPQFAHYANQKISGEQWRITYRYDPVAEVPLNVMGYLHSGTEVNFQNYAHYTVQPLLLDRLPPRPGPQDILDHLAYKFITL